MRHTDAVMVCERSVVGHARFTAAGAPARRSSHPASRQRGQLFLFSLLLIVAVGVTLSVYGASSEVTRAVQADTGTRAVLEQAREALVARAVADNNRPGSLPCPDSDNDGDADLFVGVDCPSYIGRLPWRTLGTGDLRDEAGERLWYVLSPNFRDYTTVQINSDTKGTRTVYSGSVSTVVTTQAVALVFAPGVALSGQYRDAATAACVMSGTSVSLRRDLCASNYLESDSSVTPGWNNATASGAFMSASTSLAFNDKLLILRDTDFMPLVERRVARDLREVLRTYRENSKAASALAGGCDCFPFPDANNDGVSDGNANRGRIPVTALPHAWGFSDWRDPVTHLPVLNPVTGLPFAALPSLPSYFVPNNWHTVIYYSVAKTSLQNAGSGCTTCSENLTLSVDGTSGYGLALITPGTSQPNQTRTSWAHYIDDAENRDANPQAAGGGAAADPAPNDAYVTPPAACPSGQCPTIVGGVQRCIASSSLCPLNVTAPTRDRLYFITAPPPNAQCGPNATTLRTSAPCHSTGNNVTAVCQQARDNLQACGCAASADIMITPPCRNTLNPPECQAAVQNLQTCTS